MKPLKLIWILLVNLCLVSCVNERKEEASTVEVDHEFTNNLINESSPYLLQHAHNPVNWHAWNEETLKKAKEENKPLLISIGYAACHWCHVMEEESFEDPEVARIMNENFIAIKVDREERPDVDNIYMNAAQLMTGGGGWPLNILALPDGKPYYAGTYFPKDDWLKVLKHYVDLYKNDLAAIKKQAKKVTQGINSLDEVPLIQRESSFSLNNLDSIYSQFKP